MSGLVILLVAVGVALFGTIANLHDRPQNARAFAPTRMADTSAVCTASPAPPVRSVSLIAAARMVSLDKPLPSEFAPLVVGAIAEHLKVPQPLQLAAYSGSDTRSDTQSIPSDSGTAHLSFSMELMIDWKKNGTLKRLVLSQSSLSPELDAAIILAVRAADSARAFPTRLDGVAGKEVHTFLDVDLVTELAAGSHGLFRATLPVFLMESPAGAAPWRVVPKYPSDLRQRGVEGDVTFEFVVDEHGRALVESFRAVKFSHTAFAKAAFETLPAMRFTPARMHGCPIKQVVRQSFSFRLGYGESLPILR